MLNKKPEPSSNVIKFPNTTLMHASIESGEIFFNKPFESVKDVQDFIIWLVKNGVNSHSIKDIDGTDLTQEECVGKDCFILSHDAINLCFQSLQIIHKDARVLFTDGVEEQVSLILNHGKKTA